MSEPEERHNGPEEVPKPKSERHLKASVEISVGVQTGNLPGTFAGGYNGGVPSAGTLSHGESHR